MKKMLPLFGAALLVSFAGRLSRPGAGPPT